MDKGISEKVTMRHIEKMVVALFIGLVFQATVSTQVLKTSNTDGKTPGGIAPGAPAGSYPLSGLESINPYSGSLNFRFPLVRIGGRGSSGYTMMLPIEQKWRMEHYQWPPPTTTELYGNHWRNDQTVPVDYYLPNPNGWGPLEPRFSAGVMEWRPAGDEFVGCAGNQSVYYKKTLTRLTFKAADGTETEFRDSLTGGQPHTYSGEGGANGWCNGTSYNRGKTFVSSDGGSAIFVSDTDVYDNTLVGDGLGLPTGNLLFSDGRNFRVVDGEIVWMRDRNGNQITGMTDSLGRSVTLEPADYQTVWNDRIGFKGTGGVQRYIKVWYAQMSAVLRQTQPGDSGTTKTYSQLFAGLNLQSTQNPEFNHAVVSKIELPDGREYKFRYNVYGELARVELPSGGAIEYDHGGGLTGAADQALINPANPQVYRRLVERRVYRDAEVLNSLESRTTYSVPATSVSYVDETVKDAAGVILTRTRHHYASNAAYNMENPSPFATSYGDWMEGREIETEIFDANNNLLRRAENTWEATNESWCTCAGKNPRITQTITTLADVSPNLVSKRTFSYDQYNNRTDVYDYDYGTTAAGRLLKHEKTEYLTLNPSNNLDYTSSSINMKSLPIWTKVFDVRPDNSEELISHTETKYDEPGYPVMTYSGSGSVTGWVDPNTTARGNPTTSRTWFAEESRWIETHMQFDQFGNPRKAWDATGDANRFVETEYSSTYQYAFPTKVITPGPDPTNSHGTSDGSFVTTTYDFDTGFPLTVTDEFGQTTTTQYNDLLDRPTSQIPPNGGPQTVVEYGDIVGNLFVKTKRQLDATNWDEATSFFDGMGRTVKTQAKDSEGDVIVETNYDSLGRVDRVTNPYRAGDTVYWSKTRYDALGRAVETYAPTELANLANAQSLGTTSFDISTVQDFVGTVVTTTDASGRKGRSITNALGQLLRVDEPTGIGGTETADLGTLASPNQPTFYNYSPQGKMVRVQQGVQNRYFLYDSLGRLLRVRQPEQEVNTNLGLADPITGNSAWTAGFTYDILGNVLTATDANGTVITNTYDRAGRVKTRTYNDGITPAVSFFYDGKASLRRNRRISRKAS